MASRYHINSKGEAGKCSAAADNCPFGGEHQHYDSPAKAQVAFELSMANQTVPESVGKPTLKETPVIKPGYPVEGDQVKIHYDARLFDNRFKAYEGQNGKVVAFNGSSYDVEFADGAVVKGFNYQLVDFDLSAQSIPQTRGWTALGGAYDQDLKRLSLKELEKEKEEIKEAFAHNPKEETARLLAVQNAVNNYHKNKYGFTKEQLAFNSEALEKELRSLDKWKEASPEAVDKYLTNAKTAWENEARTEIAKSYEDNVPIRLIPVGSEVYAPYAKGSPYRKVGVPVDNGPTWNSDTNQADGPHDIVGKYHDGVQWDYVSPNTSFKTAMVPQGKGLSPRWNKINDNAKRLKEMRSKYAKDIKGDK